VKKKFPTFWGEVESIKLIPFQIRPWVYAFTLSMSSTESG